MAPRRGVPVMQDWIDILDTEKSKILDRDPNSSVAYSYGRAIKELRGVTTRIAYPGAEHVKFLGPKMIELLKRKLATEEPTTLTYSPGSSQDFADDCTDPHYAVDASGRLLGLPFKTKPIFGRIAPPSTSHRKKGKQRARSPDEDEEATPPRNGIRVDAGNTKWKPSMGGSAHALLTGLYTQCSPTNQRIWVDQTTILNLAAPFTSRNVHQVVGTSGQAIFVTVAAGIDELVARSCLFRDDTKDPAQFAFSWTGYQIAERCALECGLPKVFIELNDVRVAWTRPYLYDAQTATQAVLTHVTDQRKRKSSDRDECDFVAAYQNGSTSLTEPDTTVAGLVAPTKALGKKFATGAFASVYKAAISTSAAPAANDLPFLFSYLNSNNQRVQRREEADLKQCSTTFHMLHKVEFRSKQARHPLARLIQDKSPLSRKPPDPSGPSEMGWLPADKALEKCPGLSSGTAITSTTKKKDHVSAVNDLLGGKTQANSSKDSRAMYKLSLPSSEGLLSSEDMRSLTSLRSSLPSSSKLPIHGRTNANSFSTSNAPVSDADSNIGLISSSSWSKSTASSGLSESRPPAVNSPAQPRGGTTGGAHRDQVRPSQSATSKPDNKLPPTIPSARTIDKQLLLRPADAHAGLLDIVDEAILTFKPAVLDPHTYRIALLIDHRESGLVHDLQDQLTRSGIPCVVEQLLLGDYVWVAKRHVPLGDPYDTVVLAVCERKRKDDFVTSIKSERYREQKQRIRAAGVRKGIYLVEDHSLTQSNESCEIFEKAILTSIMQTQVVDDFTLHVALSAREAVNYLVNLTMAIHLEYQTKSLHVIPDSHVKAQSIVALQRHLSVTEPERMYLTSYSAFVRLSRKPYSTHSTWAKMVASVYGVSLEMAVDVLQQFPTLADFIEAVKKRQEYEDWRKADPQSLADMVKRRSKKPQEGDVEMFVKQKVDRPGQPRQMYVPTSASWWKLFTDDEYALV